MTRSHPPLQSTLQEIFLRSRIAIFLGAGGVGKTTLAAATAVMTARQGRRVTCLTIDPARRLADSLGVSRSVRGQICDITPILGQSDEIKGSLSFGMLDPKAVFERIIRQRTSSKEAAQRILDNKFYRYASGSLSGMQEYMALEQLFAMQSSPDVDLIVLDTPPTSNAIDFFTAPRRIIEALDGKLIRVMRRAYGSVFDLPGRWAGAVLRVLTRFTGKELLDEIMSFIDALSELFGSFAERANTVEKILHGSDVTFCLVTLPDQGTIRETRDFRDQLAALGLDVNAVVVNRSHWPRIGDVPDTLSPALAEEIRVPNARWNAAYDKEKPLIERIQKAWEGLESVVIVPYLPGGASRLDALDRLAKYL